MILSKRRRREKELKSKEIQCKIEQKYNCPAEDSAGGQRQFKCAETAKNTVQGERVWR